ncbi:MAG: hypothetical protein IPI87_20200 [Betaproteobacteria bacterium]|nr:hypothetical protein [Betaproteobacteria bacterium]
MSSAGTGAECAPRRASCRTARVVRYGGLAFVAGNPAISTGALFFSRALFDRIGGFRDLRYTHDWDFCLEASLRDEPVFVPDPLYLYRIHGANTIAAGASANAEADDLLREFYRGAVRSGQEPVRAAAVGLGRVFWLRAMEGGRATCFPPGGRASRGRACGGKGGVSAALTRPGCASVIVALNPHDHDFVATMDGWAVQAGAGDHEVIVAHDGAARRCARSSRRTGGGIRRPRSAWSDRAPRAGGLEQRGRAREPGRPPGLRRRRFPADAASWPRTGRSTSDRPARGRDRPGYFAEARRTRSSVGSRTAATSWGCRS